MAKNEPVKVAVVGLGGYGGVYVGAMLAEASEHGAEWVGAIDPAPERCDRLAEVKAKGVPLFKSLDEFFRVASADLVVLATPIHLHARQSCLALQHGANVLCEKPLCATVDDAWIMVEAAKAAGRFVAIGYQWSFSKAVQGLKAAILAGELGRPRRLKTMCSWARNHGYYHRASWAGALKSPEGDWVLDSPANNATAHYLHNMLFVLGADPRSSALPEWVQAELYRANAISSFDTAALRVRVAGGAEILFYTSHAVPSTFGPVARYEFEKGDVYFTDREFLARMKDGSTRTFGAPSESKDADKLWDAVEAVRSGGQPACGAEGAMAQTVCINGAYESMPAIATFPEWAIRKSGTGDDEVTWAEGLQSVLVQCYDQGILPAEHGGVPWARPGRRVDVRGCRRFTTSVT